MSRRLGTSATIIPAVGYGTMGIGGYFQRDDSDDVNAVATIRQAVELGLTVIDTAEGYGAGHGEEVVGQAIAPLRQRVVLASKFAPEHSGRQQIVAACDASLRRLAVDRIDLYQMHWPSADVAFADTLAGLADLVAAGKIGAIGLGNVTAGQLTRLLALAGELPIVAVQQEYSVFEPFAEQAVLPLCRHHGLTLIAYSPLGTGRLGKLAPARLAALEDFCRQRNLTPAQALLDWTVRHPQVCAIPMTRSPRHLADNARVHGELLSAADHLALAALLAPTVLEVDVAAIRVAGTLSGKAYTSLEQARANGHGLSPSPSQLAETLKKDTLLKPVKVRADGKGGYELYEGQLRYWAWRIAHDDSLPIIAQVDNNGDGHASSQHMEVS